MTGCAPRHQVEYRYFSMLRINHDCHISTFYTPRVGILYHKKEKLSQMMRKDERFALLVGKAFLREIHAGHRDNAIAFGRAFLLSLGHADPEPSEYNGALADRSSGDSMATATH